MKFSIFIFSLCSEIIVIAFLRIEKKTGIQIWHVSDGEVSRHNKLRNLDIFSVAHILMAQISKMIN